jgi:hypothetical protein
MANIWWHELPIAEVYRGVEIYGLQSRERVAECKRQIDCVMSMSGPRKLYLFACDGAHAPEARCLAKNKCLASIEDRQRALVDVGLLEAHATGCGRRATPIGRMIASMYAEQAGVPWPKAWQPPDPPYPGQKLMVQD